MRHCDPKFRPLLQGFQTEELGSAKASVYGIWRDHRLAYFNAGWNRFAEANGGEPTISREWGLGANVLHAIGGPLRDYFQSAFERCADTGKVWSHDYECSSAERYRSFNMHVYPLFAGNGLLIVNSLIEERSHDLVRFPSFRAVHLMYTDEDGLIHQCIHCRRIMRVDGSNQWDWVPAWVRDPPDNTSGGLCRLCYDFHFGPVRTLPGEAQDSD